MDYPLAMSRMLRPMDGNPSMTLAEPRNPVAVAFTVALLALPAICFTLPKKRLADGFTSEESKDTTVPVLLNITITP
jgi:hypothetical protein